MDVYRDAQAQAVCINFVLIGAPTMTRINLIIKLFIKQTTTALINVQHKETYILCVNKGANIKTVYSRENESFNDQPKLVHPMLKFHELIK